MKCPHCLVSIHESFGEIGRLQVNSATGTNGKELPTRFWIPSHQMCPECKDSIIRLRLIIPGDTAASKEWVAFPKGTARPIPPEVTDPYKSDFAEASLILNDSPKASAALSRRCLQAILREKAGTTSKDLYDQIEEVSKPGILPSHIVGDLHAVRNIGNIAAHTMKSTNTGEIIDVAPGEAEWNLDVLESLFDFYFVQPALAAKRKADLNKKLKEAGKPEIP